MKRKTNLILQGLAVVGHGFVAGMHSDPVKQISSAVVLAAGQLVVSLIAHQFTPQGDRITTAQ